MPVAPPRPHTIVATKRLESGPVRTAQASGILGLAGPTDRLYRRSKVPLSPDDPYGRQGRPSLTTIKPPPDCREAPSSRTIQAIILDWARAIIHECAMRVQHCTVPRLIWGKNHRRGSHARPPSTRFESEQLFQAFAHRIDAKVGDGHGGNDRPPQGATKRHQSGLRSSGFLGCDGFGPIT